MSGYYVQHVAGEPEGLIQRCSRCGVTLTDYTNVMIAGNDTKLYFWEVGQPLNISIGNPSFLETGCRDAIPCDRKVQ